MSRTQTRKKPAAPPRSRKRWVYLAAGAALTALVFLAVVLSPDQPPTANEYGTVTLSGEWLLPFGGNPSQDPAVGTRAPQVSGSDFQGRPLSISFDGRPTVILFLAHWCPHCQREVPAIQGYLADNDFPAEVDFISVATASSPVRPNWPSSAWLSREGWSFPTLVDDEANTAFRGFGQGAFPYYVFVDRNGLVAYRLSGEQQPAYLAELMQSLAQLP